MALQAHLGDDSPAEQGRGEHVHAEHAFDVCRLQLGQQGGLRVGGGVDEDFDVLQPGREAFDVFRNGEVRAFYFRTQADLADGIGAVTACRA